MNIGKIEQLTTPPTLYPDDESVLRAQITKLVQENQRLERENARLETIIDELRIQPND
jgi:regulator of replication initiation timing